MQTNEAVRIEQEYKAVKKSAGLFDLPRIGKIQVKGKDAYKYIQNLVTADIGTLFDNQGVHTLMCYPDGSVMDALVLYRFSEDNYFIIISSGNVEKTFKWLINRKRYHDLSINNLSEKLYHIAIHGPKSTAILQKLTRDNIKDMNYLSIRDKVEIGNSVCLVAKMGYNGEDGYDIYANWSDANKVIDGIMDAGILEGIVPVGIETRNVLRYEAKLPLYGDELIGDITPIEAGLDTFIRLDKEDFVGKDALVKQHRKGIKRAVVAFQVNSKREVPRRGSAIMANDKKVGVVALGHFSPKAKKGIGFALVDLQYSDNGTKVQISNADGLVDAKITSKKLKRCI
ncbi:MAG: glycine cleavage system protein [Firmicutes bacterium]|nr:glycine cleavage system protein [Bacillota bacterium]